MYFNFAFKDTFELKKQKIPSLCWVMVNFEEIKRHSWATIPLPVTVREKLKQVHVIANKFDFTVPANLQDQNSQ